MGLFDVSTQPRARSGLDRLHRRAQHAEVAREVREAVVRVEAARVGQDPGQRFRGRGVLPADDRLGPAEAGAIGADAEDGYDARAVSPGLGHQRPAATFEPRRRSGSSALAVVRGHRFVIPIPNERRVESSLGEKRRGVNPEACSAFQKRFPGRPK